MQIFKTVINAVFPQRCVSCGEVTDGDEFLCDYCYENIERIDFSRVCNKCGLDKKQCECKNRVFHFNSVTAPFRNGDIAKAAMYRYKFRKLSSGCEYFAREMAKTVKTVYDDIRFDGIVYVPMHAVKRLKRGFNQSEKLAKRLSEILGIKVYDRLISVKYSRKRQHDMSVKERFGNVKGMYGFNYKVTGKNILLVDDIKTTGATVDECAKQLLLAGADNVYCVTGLVTYQRKGKK